MTGKSVTIYIKFVNHGSVCHTGNHNTYGFVLSDLLNTTSKQIKRRKHIYHSYYSLVDCECNHIYRARITYFGSCELILDVKRCKSGVPNFSQMLLDICSSNYSALPSSKCQHIFCCSVLILYQPYC